MVKNILKLIAKPFLYVIDLIYKIVVFRQSDILDKISIDGRKINLIKLMVSGKHTGIIKIGKCNIRYESNGFTGFLVVKNANYNKTKVHSTYYGWVKLNEVKRLSDFYINKSIIDTKAPNFKSLLVNDIISKTYTAPAYHKYIKNDSEWMTYNLLDLNNICIYESDECKDCVDIVMSMDNNILDYYKFTNGLHNFNAKTNKYKDTFKKIFSYARLRNRGIFQYIENGDYNFNRLDYKYSILSFRTSQQRFDRVFKESGIHVTKLLYKRALLFEFDDKESLNDLSIVLINHDNYKNKHIDFNTLYTLYLMNDTVLRKTKHELMILGNDIHVYVYHEDSKIKIFLRYSNYTCHDNRQYMDF